MKLTATVQVSVDGVMQASGGPEEDERGLFERGGRAHFDNEAGAVMDECSSGQCVLVRSAHLRDFRWFVGNVGRSGRQPDLDGIEHEAQICGIDHTRRPALDEPTVLSGEVAAGVRELKATPGRELQVHGSGALFQWLLDNDLVDEMNLFTFPVIFGQGIRLFPDSGRDTALELVGWQFTPTGVTSRPTGPQGVLSMQRPRSNSNWTEAGEVATRRLTSASIP